MQAFLQDRLQCKVEVGTLAGTLKNCTRFLSEGLTEWVSRIHAPSRIVRIQGTAGSGKTQLARLGIPADVLIAETAAG